MEWARGLWRAKYGDGGDRNEGPTGQFVLYSLIIISDIMLSGWRKMIFIGFLILLVLATLFMVLSRVISRPGNIDYSLYCFLFILVGTL